MEVGSKAACRVSADRQLQQLRRANTEISESRLCAGTNATSTNASISSSCSCEYLLISICPVSVITPSTNVVYSMMMSWAGRNKKEAVQ